MNDINTFFGASGVPPRFLLSGSTLSSVSSSSVPIRPTLTLPDDIFEQAMLVSRELSTVNARIQRFFRQGSRIVRRVMDPETGRTALEPINRPQILETELSRLFKFRTTRKELAGPPGGVVNFLLNADMDFWRVPVIKGVRTMPFFNQAGQFIQEDGYHAKERVWLDTGKLDLPHVSISPSTTEMAQARALLEDLLQDCLFADDASRNNALAAILTPHMRDMVSEAIPMQLIAAQSPGAGKSTLARIIFQLAQDGPFTTLPEVKQEDEFRKRILSFLRGSPRVLVIDNINHRLDSGVFANLITAPSFSDRVLGGNETETHLNQMQWILTANRPEISGELRRRTSLVHLDVQSGVAQNRTYRRADLFDWFNQHRPRLLWAVFTLIQAWVTAGMPEGNVYEAGMRKYSQRVGGVLEYAGYGGVLMNMAQLHNQANREDEDFNTLIAVWAKDYGTGKITITEVCKLMEDHHLYPNGLQNHHPGAVGRKVKNWKGEGAHGFEVLRPYDPANHRYTLQLQAISIPSIVSGDTGTTGDTGEEMEVLDQPDFVPEVETGENAPVAPVGLLF
ncbi:hypothetical protein [Deinococcus arenicola]|uniref:AAA+ ATPase domain-containing protein n=1 Tax=Deinococcus arenicola TaxID=2994950 RepID=A0ABU4DML2_9DEIO|nr:hypothetical protein [Deinococcus sp. ZS9-10]MDV6373673.1 hypothetical protein [Deinococcus sp. ZS9-10]